jgi:hypothetical protein
MGQEPETHGADDAAEKVEPHRPATASDSSTEADVDNRAQPRNSADSAKTEQRTQRAAEDHGVPDIDHDEIEAAIPGHELDVELAQVSRLQYKRSQQHICL